MKRRRATGFLVVLLALVLVAAACGGGNDTKSTSDTTGGTKKTLQSVPGFDGTTINLGVITPTTGPVAVIGNPLTAGNQVYWDAVNAKGGVAGKYKVKLNIQDSQYTQALAQQDYAQMKDSVVMFQQLLGTPIVSSLLVNLKQDNVVAQPASLDAFWVREQQLLPLGAPYQIQAINGLDYYVNEANGKGKKICTLYQDDPYGKAGLAGLEFAAKELNFPIAVKATFKQGDKDYTAQITQLKGCDAVWLTSTPSDTAAIITKAAQTQFTPQWIAQSPTWVASFAASQLAPYLQKYFWVISEGPTWGDTSSPGMKQLLDDVKAYKPDQKPDGYFVFGYAEAWVVRQVLEKAVELGDLSRDGIVNAMNSLTELTFDGLSGDYGWGAPEDRNPPRTSTIFKVNVDKPFGLETVALDYESDAANAFSF